MNQRELFLLADDALRDVLVTIQPEQLELPVPPDWLPRRSDPTLREIVWAHSYDEAWVPDVVAGRTKEEVGRRWSDNLLGDDPIASYLGYYDAATAVVSQDLDLGAIVHLSYGDFPLSTFFEHTTLYRTFQAWAIGRFLGFDVQLPPELVDGLTEQITPQLDQLRGMGIFGPEVPVPADADAQTRLLGLTGYLRE